MSNLRQRVAKAFERLDMTLGRYLAVYTEQEFKTLNHIASSMARGLAHLASRHVLHRDLHKDSLSMLLEVII